MLIYKGLDFFLESKLKKISRQRRNCAELRTLQRVVGLNIAPSSGAAVAFIDQNRHVLPRFSEPGGWRAQLPEVRFRAFNANLVCRVLNLETPHECRQSRMS